MPSSDATPVRVVWPEQAALYHADVPLRGPDFGKWSDVPQFLRLLGRGQVLNFGLRLRPWRGSGAFKGVQVLARVKPATCADGRLNVFAGSDPEYDHTVRLGALASGDFDATHLSLAVLSKLDFSRLAPCDIDLTLVSPIGVGASLGTSAAVSVALLRAFLGPGYPAADLARLAIDAEARLAGRNTGNQDQIASAFGSGLPPSACQSLTIHDLYDFEVRGVSVGPALRGVFAHTLAVYLGGHDSSDIHHELIAELAGDEALAREKVLAMRDCAEAAEQCVAADDAAAYCRACDALLEAQRGLSHRLINDTASRLTAVARSCAEAGDDSSTGSCVPGAGGRGGTLILHFGAAAAKQRFAEQIAADHDYDDCRVFEVRLADEPPANGL